jgi:membrane fusion protein, multidrug efflux system
MKKNRVKHIVFLGVIVCLLLAFFIYKGFVGVNDKKTVAAANPISVTVCTASMERKIPKLTFTGSIEAETSAIISAKAPGRVQRVLVENGQQVQAGQELVCLESLELADNVQKSQQTVQSTQATYDNAAVDYNRTLQLYEQGAISKQSLDSAQKSLRQAQSDLSSAYASLNTAQHQYDDAIIVSPVSGRVAGKAVSVGQMVGTTAMQGGAGQLMTVEDISSVYAIINVEQKDMGAIQTGMEAEVTVDAYPGEVFKGNVEFINPVAGTANRTFVAKIKLDNAAGKLKPGMFVKISVTIGADTQVLAVPQSSIYQKQGLYYVFIADGKNAVRKQVEVGELLGDKIEINSGLEENAMVVTSNINNLKDGDSLLYNE